MAAIVHNPQESWTVRTGIDVIGSKLNDTIVNGAYPEDSLVGAYGSDQYKGHNVCIWGNEGKDVILNHGYNVVIYGGDDNDSIRNFGSNVRINGNEGSDKFIISGASENNTITDFTDGEDELWFEQGEVTAEIDTYYAKHSVVIKSAETGETLVRLEGVTSGSSNKIVWYKDDGGTMSTNINRLLANSATTDSSVKTITVTANGKLSNTRDNAIITATTGNNSIQNSGNKITINGGSGNDTITNSGTDVKINGNDGDDSVSNNGGNNVTIDGGKGKDTIFSSGNDVSIFGGDGQDSIRINTSATKVTVDGGNDNDDINNYSASALIIGGDGNDYLYNRGDGSTINGGSGDDEIHNFGASTFVISGTGKDEISNTGNNVTVDSGDGNDSVDNLGSNVSINSGDGNDTITNRGTNATNITINSGGGDDSINNIKSNVTIISGSGNDTIYNDGSNVLIDSGTGNDSIHNRAGSNVTFNYRNGDGNDTIDGLREFPTINILGDSYSSLTSNNDVIIKVGEGSITLKDAKDTSLNIIGTYTPDTTPHDDGGDDTPTIYKTQQDVIKALMHSLEENKTTNIPKALNTAIMTASNGIFVNLDDLINRFFYDYQNTIKFDENNNITNVSADKFLKFCCGINLDNDDTGAITGFDAGGSTLQKNTYDIVPESKKMIELDKLSTTELNNLPDIISLNPLTFIKNDLKIKVPNYNALSLEEKTIVNGLYSWWIEEALNLIKDSYDFTFDSDATNEIILDFDRDAKFIAAVSTSGAIAKTQYNLSGYAKSLALKINMANVKSLDLRSSPSGKLITNEKNQNDEFLLDKTLAHELTHAIMYVRIKWFESLPKYLSEGIAELTIGADNSRGLIKLLQDEQKLRNTLYNSSIEDDSPYGGGYMLWRYFAKQVSDNSKLQFPDGVYYYDGNKTMLLINSPFKGTINLTEYPYTVKHIYATRNSSKLTLIGDTTDNAIWASKGGSEMIGGRGDDVLTGGNGSDTFVYASGDGNDIFTDISSNDKIKLTSGTVDSWSISGHDVILKIGEGSITLKNAKGKKLTFIDSSGMETTKIYDNEIQEDPRNCGQMLTKKFFAKILPKLP